MEFIHKLLDYARLNECDFQLANRYNGKCNQEVVILRRRLAPYNWDVRITKVGNKLGIQFLSWDGEDLDVFRNRHNKFFGTCPVGKAVYVDTAYHKTVYHEVALDELDTVLQWMLTRKPNDIPYAFDADFCEALPIC